MAEASTHPASSSTENPILRRRINEELRNRDLPDLDQVETLNEEEENEIADGVKVNVFDYCASKFPEDMIEYDIDRNGSFVAMKTHPYSWEKLQQEFGEGRYRVQAKSGISRVYRKQETRFVAAPVKSREEKETTIADAIRAAAPPPVNQFDELAKVATLIKSLSPPPVAPPEDKSGSMMMEFMKIMMETNSKAQENVTRMMDKLQENTTKLIEKMDSNTKDMFTRLEAKIGAGNEKKEKSLDALQVMAMLQKAEEKGFNNYQKIDELAERKAGRMNGSDEEKEPTTATERLIGAALPAITAALAAKPQQPQIPLNRPQPPRQMRPANQVPNPPAARQGQRPQPQPVNPEVLPKPTKEQVMDSISVGIFQRLMEADAVRNDPIAVEATKKKAAEDVKATVNRLGITLPALLQMIPQGDMIDVAVGAGLPVEAHHWLKGFYAYLKESAGPRQPQPQPKPQTNQPQRVQPNGVAPVTATASVAATNATDAQAGNAQAVSPKPMDTQRA